MTEITVKEVAVFRVVLFQRSTQLTVQIWTAKCDFIKEYSNFDNDNYSFFSSCEIVVGKNVREQLNKLVVCKFYLTVHRFHVSVQSPTCTTYGKYLQESITAVLTPKSGIDI